MRYEDISPTMRAFLGGREAFRKMGFRPEDLYCEIAWSARFHVLSCFCKLDAQGKTFSLEVGPVNDPEAFEHEYERVAKAINGGEVSQEDCDRIWVESEPYRKKVEFVAAVVAKGFKPPRDLS
jgi:hypothetical protein